MKSFRILPLLVAASMLAACEFVGSGLAPSVTGEAPNQVTEPADIVLLDTSKLGEPSGTSAGQRMAQLRADLVQLQQAGSAQIERARQLRSDMESSVAGYQIALSAMRPPTEDAAVAKATVAAWETAQGQLRTISITLDQMNALSADVEKNVTQAAFLQQSIRGADAASDATQEDHRQLAMLEESTSATSASLDQLLQGLRQEVPVRSQFLSTESAKMAQMTPPPPPPADDEADATAQPFVVIPFKDPPVDYRQQLYDAVSIALERRPEATFDLVAVAPAAEGAEAVRASREEVKESLLSMGLPAERLSVGEVTDPSVQNNEVRLYVR